MKKNLLFMMPLFVVSILLFMLPQTGMTAHIIVSVVGLLLLVAYAVVTRKSWKCPALEVIERVFYAAALITGVMIIKTNCGNIVHLLHKASAAMFFVLLILTEINKKIKKINFGGFIL